MYDAIPNFRNPVVNAAQPSARKRRCASAILCAMLATAGCVEQAVSPRIATEGHSASSPAADDDTEIRKLLELMRQRLLLMHDVARWKWNESQPIDDPAREIALLDELAEQARARQLDPQFARRFFQAQMEAGKQVQTVDFDAWKATGQGVFTDVPDLVEVQRPALTRISRDLVASLARLQSRLDTPELERELTRDAGRILAGPGIADNIRSIVLAPLLPATQRGYSSSGFVDE